MSFFVIYVNEIMLENMIKLITKSDFSAVKKLGFYMAEGRRNQLSVVILTE